MVIGNGIRTVMILQKMQISCKSSGLTILVNRERTLIYPNYLIVGDNTIVLMVREDHSVINRNHFPHWIKRKPTYN